MAEGAGGEVAVDVGEAVLVGEIPGRHRLPGPALDAALSEWFAPRDRDDTVEQLLAAGVLAAPVWDQMVQDDLPQLAERGFTQWLEHPIAGRVGYPGTGVRADTFDNSYRAPAPTVGQHTDAVLHELGLTADEIAALRRSGVI